MSIATIARVKRLSWNTVPRWIEHGAAHAREFNDHMTQGYEITELQADEIRTFVQGKAHPLWIMATIEVSSRLWPTCVVGRRSYRNTRQLLRDTVGRGYYDDLPLITTDGFQYYAPVTRRMLEPTCIYGQVLKKWRNHRVTWVDRRIVIASRFDLDAALSRSEDSSDLNTSFIERMNLTIRQGSAYLSRRTPCHARSGKEIRTPAMQAGLASRPLTFRQIFTWANRGVLFVLLILDFRASQCRIRQHRLTA